MQRSLSCLAVLALCAASAAAAPAPAALAPQAGGADAREPALELALPARSLAWLGERLPALARVQRVAREGEPDWSEPATWSLWSATLAELGAAPARGATLATSRARATLARLALAQGRSDDAWRHLAQARALPDAELAELLARLALGAEADSERDEGARSAFGPWPEGVLLAPSLPPPLDDTPQGRMARRELRLAGLRVGAAEVALHVALEPEGVQLDLEHRGGASVRVRVRAPLAPELEPLALLVDWDERPLSDAPVELTLSAEDPRHTLWLRCRPRATLGPSALPAQVPAGLELGGIALGAVADAPAPLDAAARAVAQCSGVRCRAPEVHAGSGPAVPEPAGLWVLLRPGAEGRRELAHLVHLVEAWTLGEAP